MLYSTILCTVDTIVYNEDTLAELFVSVKNDKFHYEIRNKVREFMVVENMVRIPYETADEIIFLKISSIYLNDLYICNKNDHNNFKLISEQIDCSFNNGTIKDSNKIEIDILDKESYEKYKRGQIGNFVISIIISKENEHINIKKINANKIKLETDSQSPALISNTGLHEKRFIKYLLFTGTFIIILICLLVLGRKLDVYIKNRRRRANIVTTQNISTETNIETK